METARVGNFVVVVVKLKLFLLFVAVCALCPGCVVYTFTWSWWLLTHQHCCVLLQLQPPLDSLIEEGGCLQGAF